MPLFGAKAFIYPVARVRLTKEQRCPFLCGDGLCFIQRRSEESNLSETCRTHPRVLRFWGQGYGELSLQVSCPHAADLIFDGYASNLFLYENIGSRSAGIAQPAAGKSAGHWLP